jgi:hypothetical protein
MSGTILDEAFLLQRHLLMADFVDTPPQPSPPPCSLSLPLFYLSRPSLALSLSPPLTMFLPAPRRGVWRCPFRPRSTLLTKDPIVDPHPVTHRCTSTCVRVHTYTAHTGRHIQSEHIPRTHTSGPWDECVATWPHHTYIHMYQTYMRLGRIIHTKG